MEDYINIAPVNKYDTDLFIVKFLKSGITWLSHILANCFLLSKKSLFRATFFNFEMLVGDIHKSKEIVKVDDLPFRLMQLHAFYNPNYKQLKYD